MAITVTYPLHWGSWTGNPILNQPWLSRMTLGFEHYSLQTWLNIMVYIRKITSKNGWYPISRNWFVNFNWSRASQHLKYICVFFLNRGNEDKPQDISYPIFRYTYAGIGKWSNLQNYSTSLDTSLSTSLSNMYIYSYDTPKHWSTYKYKY